METNAERKRGAFTEEQQEVQETIQELYRAIFKAVGELEQEPSPNAYVIDGHLDNLYYLGELREHFYRGELTYRDLNGLGELEGEYLGESRRQGGKITWKL